MRWDDILTIICIIAAVAFFFCLKAVQRIHDKDPHFMEEEERRKEEYRRKTAEANRERELKDVLDEGYSYGDIPDDEDDDK